MNVFNNSPSINRVKLAPYPPSPSPLYNNKQAVLVRSNEGLGGMSRMLHRVFLDCLIPKVQSYLLPIYPNPDPTTSNICLSFNRQPSPHPTPPLYCTCRLPGRRRLLQCCSTPGRLITSGSTTPTSSS